MHRYSVFLRIIFIVTCTVGIAGAQDSTAADTVKPEDRVRPEVASVSLEPDGILAAGDVTVTVTFNEEMNRKNAPRVTFGDRKPFRTSVFKGGWKDGKTWSGTGRISQKTANGVNTVSIDQAQDLAGNAVKKHTDKIFTADTRAPVVSSADLSVENGLQGPGTVKIIVEFDEKMDRSSAPAVSAGLKAPFGDLPFKGSWQNEMQWAGEAAVTAQMPNGTHTISITGGKDAVGNEQKPVTKGSFRIDTETPAVKNITVTPAAAGSGQVAVSVVFSEPVNRDVSPVVSLGMAEPFNTLTAAGGWESDTGWKGSVEVSDSAPNGAYKIRVSGAADPAGNVMQADTRNAMTVDTKAPAVTRVAAGDTGVRATGTVPVELTFNEKMDNRVSLRVTAEQVDGAGVITAKGKWSGESVWSGSVLFTDAAANGRYRLAVQGGADAVGNTMEEYGQDLCRLDSKKPEITGAVWGKDGILGIGTVTLQLAFSEAMNTGEALTVTLGQKAPYRDIAVAGKFTSPEKWEGSVAITDKNAGGAYTLAASGGKDPAGNPCTGYKTGGITIDTKAPAVASVTTDPAGIIGAGQCEISVIFTETMDAAVPLKVTFGEQGKHTVTGDWMETRRWQGMVTVGQEHTDGKQTLQVSGAKDMAGNTMIPDGNHAITIDKTPPQTVSVTAGEGAVLGLGVHALKVRFSEEMNRQGSLTVTFGPETAPDAFTVAGSWTAADAWEGKITVDALTPSGSSFIMVSGATDLAGNPMAADNKGRLIADPVIPAVTGVGLTPDGAVGVGPLKAVISFSEEMDKTSAPVVSFGKTAFKGAWTDTKTWAGEVVIDAGMANGEQSVVVSGARDLAGNPVEKGIKTMFVLDTRPPVISGASVVLAGGDKLTSQREIPFSYNGFSDAGSGIDTYYWSITDGGGTKNGTAAEGDGGIIPVKEDGPVSVYVWAADAAGNISKSVTASVTVDSKSPVVRNVAVAGPALKKAGPVTAVITFSEPLDKDRLPEVSFGGSAPYADYPLTVRRSSDSTVNVSGMIAGDAPNGGQKIIISGGADPAGNPLMADTSGTFSIDTRIPACVSVSLDKQSPVGPGAVTVTAVFEESMSRQGALKVNIAADGSGSSPAAVTGSWRDEKTWQGSCSLAAAMPGGLQTVTVSAGTDIAGNVMEPDRSLAFEFDSAPPEVVSVLTEPEGVAAAGSVSVSVSFSEALDPAAVPAVSCGPDGSFNALKLTGRMTEPTVWQGVLAVTGTTPNGNYTLAVKGGKDAAGNTLKEYTGSTFKIDTEPPVLSAAMVKLEGGAPVTNKRKLALSVSGVSDGDGAGLLRLYYGTEDKGGTAAGTVFSAEGTAVSAAADGRYTVFVWAEDKAGNISPAVSASIMIDATPPVITNVTSGQPDKKLHGGFAVTVSFSEPVGTDGPPAVTAGTAAPYDRAGMFTGGAWRNDSTWQVVLAMDSLMYGGRLGLAVKGVSDRAGNVMDEDLTQRVILPAVSYYQYGISLAEAGKTAAALKALDACLELRPGYMNAHMKRGEIYRLSGQTAKAVEVYRRALNVDPLDGRLYTRLSELLTGQNKNGEALAAAESGLRTVRAVSENPVPFREIPVREIIPGYLDHKDDDFTLFNAHMAAGLAHAAAGNHDGAQESFSGAVGMNDEFPAAHYNLGRARYGTGDASGAVTELFQALGQDSTFQEAALLLGIIAAGHDSVSEAESHYGNVTRTGPARMARVNSAVLAARAGNLQKAAGILETAYRDHPGGMTAYNLGVVLQALGKTDRAMTLFDKAGADNAFAACRKGVLLTEKGEYKAAAAELVRALTLEPAMAEAAYTLGLLNQQQGFLEEAELWYRRAVVFDPEYMEAYANLGIIYGRMGMGSKEKASYARAQSLKKKRQVKAAARAGADIRPVAITSFDNISGNAGYDWLRVGIAEALTSDLKEMADLNLVERLKVEITMQEMALAATDIIADKAGEMGKLTGAQLIVSGSFQLMDGQIKIDARLIDAATGEVKTATSSRGLLDSIFTVQRTLAVNLLKEMGIGGPAGIRSGTRHTRSLDALRYLSEGRTSFYKGDRDGSLEKMRKAAELDESFRDALVDMELESTEEKSQRTLAVMSFGNASGDEKYGWMGGGIAEALTTDLRKVTGLFLVERLALNKALNELHLGKTDIVDEKSAPRIGKMVGAGAVIMGSYQVAAEKVRIDARMVEVAGGKILMTETVQGSVDDLYDLEEQLAFKIADVLNISVSIAEREQMARDEDPAAAALKNIALSQSGTAEELPVDEADKALALVPFKNNCGADARRYGWMQQSIRDVMTTEFQQSGLVRLVDRQVMQVRMGEAALEGLVGMDDLEKSMRKMIPADFLLQGGYQVVGDKLRIDSRLVEVETGSILFSESAHGSSDDILGVQLDLSAKILGSIRQSARGKTGGGAVIVDDGGMMKTPTLWVAGGAGVTSILTTISHLMYRNAADEYENAVSGFDEAADIAERRLQTRNFLLGTMVTAWTAAGSSWLWNKYIRQKFLRPEKPEPAVADVGGLAE